MELLRQRAGGRTRLRDSALAGRGRDRDTAAGAADGMMPMGMTPRRKMDMVVHKQMTIDEARMTKETRMTNPEREPGATLLRHSVFVILSSFELRHSSLYS